MPWVSSITRRVVGGGALAGALAVVGCGSPSKVNIELRKEIQSLQARIDSLESRHAADQAALRGLEANATTVPVLPQDRIDALFTTHGLRFGRLTGGADLDEKNPGDEGFKVYVVPVDGAGDPLKAAGGFVVQAFDLAEAEDPLVGEWKFPAEEARKHWYGQGLLYEYVLTCRWQQRVPTNRKLTLQVTFTDALTGRVFTQKRDIEIQPPAPPGTPPARSTEP